LGESRPTLAVHGHFYQPPREDPWTGEVPLEPGAAPYHDFNEKITAECYRPLAERCLFERISFNVGPTLISWLARRAPETYRRILEADHVNVARGVGNAIAQSVHHTILPLARRRDRVTQIYWGIRSFQHRFGRHPRGMWLPEMAVDLATLEVLAELGLTFTLLSSEQVRGPLPRGAGPYRVRLEANAYFTVFVRDRDLSNQVSFAMPSLGPADRWAAEALRGRTGLTLLATDGETFGHHHREGVDFLDRSAPAAGGGLRGGDPHRIPAGPSASGGGGDPAEHGVELRPRAGPLEHRVRLHPGGFPLEGDPAGGHGSFGGGDRRGLSGPGPWLDPRSVAAAGRIHPRGAGGDGGPALLREFADRPLPSDVERRLLLALQAQVHRQRMFASCGWFFEDLDGLEPRLVIRQAARAIELIEQATGVNLAAGYRRALAPARSGRTGKTGDRIFDELWTARPRPG
jgi:hypothetical protein